MQTVLPTPSPYHPIQHQPYHPPPPSPIQSHPTPHQPDQSTKVYRRELGMGRSFFLIFVSVLISSYNSLSLSILVLVCTHSLFLCLPHLCCYPSYSQHLAQSYRVQHTLYRIAVSSSRGKHPTPFLLSVWFLRMTCIASGTVLVAHRLAPNERRTKGALSAASRDFRVVAQGVRVWAVSTRE
jgi:hypothetical protein